MKFESSISRYKERIAQIKILFFNVTLQFMVFRVLIFGSLARELACTAIAVDVPNNAVLRDVNEALALRHPHKAAFFRGARLAVNHAFQRADAPLGAHDEIAVVELVGGG